MNYNILICTVYRDNARCYKIKLYINHNNDNNGFYYYCYYERHISKTKLTRKSSGCRCWYRMKRQSSMIVTAFVTNEPND